MDDREMNFEEILAFVKPKINTRKYYDRTGLNTREDLDAIVRWGVWRSMHQWDSSSDMPFHKWCVWKTKRFLLDQVGWRKGAYGRYIELVRRPRDFAENIPWPPEIPVESDENVILNRAHIKKIIRQRGSSQHNFVLDLLLDDEGWNQEEIGEILELCPSRISQLIKEIKEIVNV